LNLDKRERLIMTESLTCSAQNNYCLIDLCKFVCSLFVVGIHCNVFVNNAVMNDFITQGLFRLAIPLFYTISGFLFSAKVHRNGVAALIKQERKLVIVYMIWSAVYFVESVCKSLFLRETIGLELFKKYAWNMVFRASKYHLWYLLALIYALPLFYFLITKVKIRFQIAAIGLLWLIQCFAFSYHFFAPEFGGAVFTLSQTIDAIWNTFFCAIPLLLVGNLINHFSSNGNQHKKLFFLIVSFLLIIEKMMIVIVLKSPANAHFLLFMPLFAFFLVLVLAQSTIEIKYSIYLRKASLLMYCVHPLIIDFLLVNNISYGMLCFLIVSSALIILTLSFFCVKEKIKCF